MHGLRFLAGAAILAGSACVWTQVRWLEPHAPRRSSCPEGVVIYTDARAVPTPHLRMADIAATHSPGYRPDVPTLENALRKKAARIGANAILAREDRAQGVAMFVPSDSVRSLTACGRT